MAKEKSEKKTKRPTALKRQMQSEKRREKNRKEKSTIRTTVRKYREGIALGDKVTSEKQLAEVYSVLDKAVKHGIMKINKAARTKARLASKLHAKA